MQTAFAPNAFQNNAFQIVIVITAVPGGRAEAFISQRILEEEREIMELIMMFVKSEDMF